jgi:hypothetical protein
MPWNNLGHQLVCDIAWRSMSGKSRDQIKALLHRSGYKTFAGACHWPDRIRGEAQWEWTAPYHYINVPQTAITVSRDYCPDAGCVLSGIEQYKKLLTSVTSRNERLHTLLFLAHYVADVHQPMHVSYAIDNGGNKLELNFMGEETNLHQLWDGRLLTRADHPDWMSMGSTLFAQATREDLSEPVTDPLDWANESLQLTRQIYRDLPPGGKLTIHYYETYNPVALRRIKQSGKRLGLLLDSLLSNR